jgi:hypothetical protein
MPGNSTDGDADDDDIALYKVCERLHRHSSPAAQGRNARLIEWLRQRTAKLSSSNPV